MREAEVGEHFGVDFAENADGLAAHGEGGDPAVDERRMLDRRVLGLPAQLAQQRVDHAASRGVAAFAADFDERQPALFGRARFGRIVELDDVVDFKQPLRHRPAAIFAQRFEQAAHEMRAHDVVRFQLRIRDFRVALGRRPSAAARIDTPRS